MKSNNNKNNKLNYECCICYEECKNIDYINFIKNKICHNICDNCLITLLKNFDLKCPMCRKMFDNNIYLYFNKFKDYNDSYYGLEYNDNSIKTYNNLLNHTINDYNKYFDIYMTDPIKYYWYEMPSILYASIKYDLHTFLYPSIIEKNVTNLNDLYKIKKNLNVLS